MRKRHALSHPIYKAFAHTLLWRYSVSKASMKQPFIAKKSLGQNFLINPKVAEKIAISAEITSGQTVLEIGPGTGMLTRALLAAGAHVVAVEADIRAVEVLRSTFVAEIENGSLVLFHGDIRTIDFKSLTSSPSPEGNSSKGSQVLGAKEGGSEPYSLYGEDTNDAGNNVDAGLLAGSYKVAANIPYYLSGMLFEMMLSAEHQPEMLVFLVQKEVAERIARSKKESILSLSIKAYGTPSYRGTVTRGNFRPQPNVDSAILAIRGIGKDAFATIDEALFFRVLKAGFSARRKHLLSNLSVLVPREALQEIFSELDIPLDIRGEDLPIEIWLRLAKHISLSPQLKKDEEK